MRDFQSSSILLTGGAGFIGSNFAHFLVDNGFSGRLVILDKLTYAGDLNNLGSLLALDNVHFCQGDIADSALVANLFERFQFDLILNFAAESHVDKSISSPSDFIDTNVKGTLVLLQSALFAWDGNFCGKLFFQVSTDEVYGTLEEHESAFNECSAFRPNSPYSASKAAAEHLVRAWNQTYGLPTLISNCSNNYGPNQHFEKLIPLIIKQLYKGEKVPIYGDGLQKRDWLHVLDHCEAIQLLVHKGELGQSYCIGSGCEHTNIQVVSAIATALSNRAELDFDFTDLNSIISHVTDRLGHDRRYAINSNKLKALGWNPRYSFEDGIRDVANWYVDNIKRLV